MAEKKTQPIDIDGREVTFVEVFEMDLNELEYVMERTGMTAIEAEQALRMGNALTWKAVLNVAARRTRPGANVDVAVGKLKLAELIDRIYPDAEEDVESPPAEAVEEETTDSTSSTADLRAVSGNP